MNTKCPQCDASYGVTEAHIGRKVKCKSCSAALVVTEDGLEFQSGAAASPPPPPPASAFDFDGGQAAGGHDEDDAPRRRSSKAKSRRRDEEDDDDAREDARPVKSGGRAAKGPKAPSNFGAYLAFRKMIVPVIIQLIFWLIVGVILLGALASAASGLMSGNTQLILIALASIVIGVPIGILVVRMYCELIIVVFRMHDTLIDIKQLLEKQAGGGGPPASEG